MYIADILSCRDTVKQTYMDIVYEWEDDLSNFLRVPIKSAVFAGSLKNKIIYNRVSSKLLSEDFISYLYQGLDKWNSKKGKSLMFNLYPPGNCLNNVSCTVNSLPIVIDYWKYEAPDRFYKTYKNCPIVFITSLEVLNHLKKEGVQLNMQHLPVSLSDRYRNAFELRAKRKFDIILPGRRNELLWSYLEEFGNKYRDVEYVYQTGKNGKIFYESNKKGLLGSYDLRTEYLNLLQEGSISFYSTPGMDGGESRTGGFNPLTPRYLEFLAAGNFLLGRYPDNEEAKFFELNKVCPSINGYDHFEKTLINYLNIDRSQYDFTLYDKILNKHFTSTRSQELLQLIHQ